MVYPTHTVKYSGPKMHDKNVTMSAMAYQNQQPWANTMFLNKNYCILILILLKIVPKGPNNNKSAYVINFDI